MDLNLLSSFVEVARAGNLSAAARHRGLSKATLSRQLASLEAELGVTLLDRSTRRQKLTVAGERLYRKAAGVLEGLLDLKAEVLGSESGLAGSVRLTAPVEVGTRILGDVLGDFRREHPKIDLQVRLSNVRLDILEEGIDVALRAGPLEDSRLKSLRLGLSSQRLYASDRYLKEAGRPKKISELAQHELIAFAPRTGPLKWKLSSGGARSEIVVPDRLRVDNLELASQFALQGLGIALLPRFLCDGLNTLRPVLEDWRGDEIPFSLVYKADRHQRPAVRSFLDYLKKRLKDQVW